MKKKVITLLIVVLTIFLDSCSNKNPDPKEVRKKLLQEFTDRLAKESDQSNREIEYWIRESSSRELTKDDFRRLCEAGGRLKEVKAIEEFVIVESEKK